MQIVHLHSPPKPNGWTYITIKGSSFLGCYFALANRGGNGMILLTFISRFSHLFAILSNCEAFGSLEIRVSLLPPQKRAASGHTHPSLVSFSRLSSPPPSLPFNTPKSASIILQSPRSPQCVLSSSSSCAFILAV